MIWNFMLHPIIIVVHYHIWGGPTEFKSETKAFEILSSCSFKISKSEYDPKVHRRETKSRFFRYLSEIKN